MIEVPSAAVMAGSLARHADFFSIGTNDLTQYTLAVDRGSAQVADLFATSDPAVLRLMRTAIEGARTTGIDVSICGEMAGEPKYVMPLLGMGVRALSVTPTLIPETRKIIGSVDIDTCQRVADKALEMECQQEIDAYLTEQAKPFLPQLFQTQGPIE
jgi:phosphotransferase system enzyme I (PtsI)